MTDKVYYNIDTILKKKFKNLRREFFNIKKVNICTYKINNSLDKKFLEYLLYKDNDNNILYFPRFTYDVEQLTNQKNPPSFIDIAKDKIKNIFKDIDKLEIIYNGYLLYNNELYIFYELIGNFYFIKDKITKKSNFIFATIHEIINDRKYFNFPILNTVTEIFFYNPLLIYLKDSQGNNIEIPTILYYGSESAFVDFISLFGVKKQQNIDIFGPYYYFLTYEDSIRYAGWTSNFKPLKLNNKLYTVNKHGKYKTGSIIRFAVFLGNISVKLNLKNDSIDSSKIIIQKNNNQKSLNIIKKKELNKILKISDRSGEWTNKYNSIYTSKSTLIESFVFTINDINDALCLTIQDIDNSKLPDKYDNKNITSQNILL